MIKLVLTLNVRVKHTKRTSYDSNPCHTAGWQDGRDHASRCECTRVVPSWTLQLGRLELLQKSAFFKLLDLD